MTTVVKPSVVSDPGVRRELIRDAIGRSMPSLESFRDIPEVQVVANVYYDDHSSARIGGGGGATFIGAAIAVVGDWLLFYGHEENSTQPRDRLLLFPTENVHDATELEN